MEQMKLNSERVVLARMPRSKKLRIRRKWYYNPANWRPDARVWSIMLTLGAEAYKRCPGAIKYDTEGKQLPSSYEMHPAAWAAALRANPKLAERFETFDNDAWLREQGYEPELPWKRPWRNWRRMSRRNRRRATS